MARTEWSDYNLADGIDETSIFAHVASYGALWLVVEINDEKVATRWRVTLDSPRGLVLRKGELPAGLSREKSWEVACEASTTAAEALLGDLVDDLRGQLEAQKRTEAAVRAKAFRRGAQQGVFKACEEIEKRATQLRSEAATMERSASDVRFAGNNLANACVDSYGKTE